MSKPTKLRSEAALELFRFATESLVKALWPNMDPRKAATRAMVIQQAVIGVFISEVDDPAITPPRTIEEALATCRKWKMTDEETEELLN